MTIQNNSMMFGNTDLREAYGIIIEEIIRPFLPQLRSRKVEIPERDGAYDYGAKYRQEIPIEVRFGTVKLLSRSAVRELIYELSFKNKIVFWDEPDKYYIGRLYEPGTAERIAGSMRKFELTFICDPYAYGKTVTEEFARTYTPSYAGSAPTPTRLQIQNIGNNAVSGIHITITRRKEAY